MCTAGWVRFIPFLISTSNYLYSVIWKQSILYYLVYQGLTKNPKSCIKIVHKWFSILII